MSETLEHTNPIKNPLYKSVINGVKGAYKGVMNGISSEINLENHTFLVCLQEICRGEYDEKVFNNHILKVVENVKIISNGYDVDLEILTIGAYLHDITKKQDKNEHNEALGEYADKLMKKYGYSKEKREKVREIIKTHSGIYNKNRTNLEAIILADSDAVSFFQLTQEQLQEKIGGDLSKPKYKQKLLAKIEKCYSKIVLKKSFEIINERYEELLQMCV